MPSIFVSIASYRDPELSNTVRSLIETRTGDTALHIRILAQGEPGEALADDFADMPGVTIAQTVIPSRRSRGVCWARAEIQRAYAGEDFYLQLDSHMVMAQGWDEILFADHRAASIVRPAVLTAYLPPYTITDTERTIGDMRPVHFKVVQLVLVRFAPPNEVPDNGSATTDSSLETCSAGTALALGAEIVRRLRAASSITVPERSRTVPSETVIPRVRDSAT